MWKSIIAVGILFVIGMGVFIFNNQVMLDRINPVTKIDDYYTVVDTEGKHQGKDSIRKDEESYEYDFIGFNKEGKKQEITIKVTKKLAQEAYLKIISKGRNGKSWQEVERGEIPEDVLAELK